MLTTPERLGPRASDIVRKGDTRLLLSAASSWEIAIKYALGRLALPQPPDTFVPERMRRTGVEGLPILHSHALRVADLEPHHRDPFDRLLVAQAQVESLALLTSDTVFARYSVEVIDSTA